MAVDDIVNPPGSRSHPARRFATYVEQTDRAAPIADRGQRFRDAAAIGAPEQNDVEAAVVAIERSVDLLLDRELCESAAYYLGQVLVAADPLENRLVVGPRGPEVWASRKGLDLRGCVDRILEGRDVRPSIAHLLAPAAPTGDRGES